MNKSKVMVSVLVGCALWLSITNTQRSMKHDTAIIALSMRVANLQTSQILHSDIIRTVIEDENSNLLDSICNAEPVYGYHEIRQQTDGRYFATVGAMTYVLDEKGKRLSEGYHEIKLRGNVYVAHTGAMEYILDYKTCKKM